MHMLVYKMVIGAVVTGMYMCSCQDCTYPTNDDLKDLIKVVIASGDSSTTHSVNVIRFHPVCIAFSEKQGLYRSLSVVVQYTCSGHANCPPGTAEEQIESDCINGQWSNNVLSITKSTHSLAALANFSTTTREDCAFCLSPELANMFSLTTDAVTHCVACVWSCNKHHRHYFGLGTTICVGSSNSTRNFYHNSMRVNECPNPSWVNTINECICPIERICEEGAECYKHSPKDESATVIYTYIFLLFSFVANIILVVCLVGCYRYKKIDRMSRRN